MRTHAWVHGRAYGSLTNRHVYTRIRLCLCTVRYNTCICPTIYTRTHTHARTHTHTHAQTHAHAYTRVHAHTHAHTHTHTHRRTHTRTHAYTHAHTRTHTHTHTHTHIHRSHRSIYKGTLVRALQGCTGRTLEYPRVLSSTLEYSEYLLAPGTSA